jgi:hypothetical protein
MPTATIGVIYPVVVKEKPLSSYRRKKRVRFAPMVTGIATPSLDDYSDEEINSAWYNQNDFAAMKKHDKTCSVLMSNGKLLSSDDDYTFRGLEYRTKAGASVRRGNRLRAVLAALLEQERQLKECDEDDRELLADRYYNACYDCSLEAHTRGKKDAKDAQATSYSANTVSDKLSTIDLELKPGNDKLNHNKWSCCSPTSSPAAPATSATAAA